MKKIMNWVLASTLCICGAIIFTSCSNDNSGGRTVGRLLAEKLGVPFFDKAVIKALQEKYHLISADDKTEEEMADLIMQYIGGS